MRMLLFASCLLLVSSAVYADEAPKAPAIAFTQEDVTDLNRVLTEQVPSRWAQPVVDWMNAIIRRSQVPAKVAEAPKAPEPAKMPESESGPKKP